MDMREQYGSARVLCHWYGGGLPPCACPVNGQLSTLIARDPEADGDIKCQHVGSYLGLPFPATSLDTMTTGLSVRIPTLGLASRKSPRALRQSNRERD
ncbi:hypothetical protein HJFPF1_05339 [Paramyrothecium foliicola]|nr:hypothetical protein HJFPF1_05339 [Paramyrothecium foliicola]